MRFNTDLQSLEYNAGFGYLPIQVCPPDYVSGMTIGTNSFTTGGASATGFTVSPGVVNMLLSTGVLTKGAANTVFFNKFLSAFSLGDGGGAHGVTVSAPGWYRVFAIWKDDYTIDFGVDSSSTATNLLAAANALSPGFAYYRRIGWVYYTAGSPGPGSYEIRAFNTVGDGSVKLARPYQSYAGATFNTTALNTVDVLAPSAAVAEISLDSVTTGGAGGALYATVYAPSYAGSRAASATEHNYRTQRIGSGADVVGSQVMQVPVSSTNKIGIIWSAAPTGSWTVNTLGWRDDRQTA
jgi:hypothetical protein